MMPVRGPPLEAATANCTAAVPLPEAPDWIVTHGESDVAVQLHNVLDARTSNAPLPPACPKLFDGSESV